MKRFLIVLCSLCITSAVTAQSKPASSAAATPELPKLLLTIGLPYKVVNDSVAVIPYTGDNIESYQVVIRKIADLYIIYTDLSETFPGKIDESKYKYLLQLSDRFDIVKTGLDGQDGTVYLRADVYKNGMNTALLKRLVTQVANVTNIIGGELK